MPDHNYIYLIAGMWLVSFIPRWVPLFFLSKRKMPQLLIEWLDLIPVAILSALLFPALLTQGAPKLFTPFSMEMLVAVPTLLFAWFSRSLGGTLITGMFLFWCAGKFL